MSTWGTRFFARLKGALEFLFETGAGYRSTSTLKEDDWEAQSGVAGYENVVII